MPAKGKSMKKIIYISAALLLPVFVSAQLDSSSKQISLQELVIKEINPSLSRPLTFSSLESKKLKQLYFGADIPTVLQQLPSINTYSDNGTGIGYSFFRMRGMDQTRINTTINGIPVNDPENQGVFFANFADLLSGVEEVQVQRGLGTSTNGTSAFGGSVQIALSALEQKRSAEVQLGVGSFGSNRITANIQSGLINKKWLSQLRIGMVQTNGFRNNSAAEVHSYQVSFVRLLAKSSIRFNSFGGATSNQLSYLGIDKQTFEANAKSNPFVNGESDAFRQFFNQIQYFRRIGLNQTLNASVYFVRSAAPKFQFLFPASWGYSFDWFNMPPIINGNDTNTMAGDMMTSYRLDQKFYGAFVTHSLKLKRFELNSGLHANYFSADHFMEVNYGKLLPNGILPNHEVYRNTGVKRDLSAFLKGNLSATDKLSLFVDVQIRMTSFSYKDKDMAIRPSFGMVEDMQWVFLNPRVGLNQTFKHGQTVYIFTGLGFREPTRFDYLQDDFAISEVQQTSIKPEQLWNTEMGYRFITNGFKVLANAYFMEFQNQIVSTGALNNFGYPITGNIGRSWRRGLESEVLIPFDKMFSMFANASISMNGAKDFTQTYYSEDYANTFLRTYKNTPLALSPNQIHLLGFQFNSIDQKTHAAINGRYVGKQYLDNTGDEKLSIPSFYTVDIRFAYLFRIKYIRKTTWQIRFNANNLLNQKYAPFGSLGGLNTLNVEGQRNQFSLFMPAAGTNFFLTLSASF
jgi:iron complex outermembrane receptor protein